MRSWIFLFFFLSFISQTAWPAKKCMENHLSQAITQRTVEDLFQDTTPLLMRFKIMPYQVKKSFFARVFSGNKIKSSQHIFKETFILNPHFWLWENGEYATYFIDQHKNQYRFALQNSESEQMTFSIQILNLPSFEHSGSEGKASRHFLRTLANGKGHFDEEKAKVTKLKLLEYVSILNNGSGGFRFSSYFSLFLTFIQSSDLPVYRISFNESAEVMKDPDSPYSRIMSPEEILKYPFATQQALQISQYIHYIGQDPEDSRVAIFQSKISTDILSFKIRLKLLHKPLETDPKQIIISVLEFRLEMKGHPDFKDIFRSYVAKINDDKERLNMAASEYESLLTFTMETREDLDVPFCKQGILNILKALPQDIDFKKIHLHQNPIR
ncbi:MAG: hypothetical protein KBD63_03315 [Bacteriovoracaceae bacterium]|nr:hypothetical protein [Bacteriovoracaceae bacterium]